MIVKISEAASCTQAPCKKITHIPTLLTSSVPLPCVPAACPLFSSLIKSLYPASDFLLCQQVSQIWINRINELPVHLNMSNMYLYKAISRTKYANMFMERYFCLDLCYYLDVNIAFICHAPCYYLFFNRDDDIQHTLFRLV